MCCGRASCCSRPSADRCWRSPAKRASAVLRSGAGSGALAKRAWKGLLHDKTRPPGTPPHDAHTLAAVLALTCSEPPGEVTHWTGRAVAKAVGISLRSVQRIWNAHHLQPHRVRTFKRSHDPAFAEKVEDIVGLYMDPPAHAVVLSIDEKSQIQALERTRSGLPLGEGHPASQTHDYVRHGTTTLFAALNVLEGTVLGRCMQRHRHGEFIRFLNAVEAAVPPGKLVHVVLDNYATHKHPKVRAWLARHPRWTFHFTPTSASWMNAVEGFFSALTRRRLRRGTFLGVVDLQAAIKRYIAEHNRNTKPFAWTKAGGRHPRRRQSSACTISLSRCTSSFGCSDRAPFRAGYCPR